MFHAQVVGLIQVSNGTGCKGEWGAAAKVQIPQFLWPQPKGMSHRQTIQFHSVNGIPEDTYQIIFISSVYQDSWWFVALHCLFVCVLTSVTNHSTVWCHPSEPALWTGQVGHPARGNWVHRGGNDDVCCPAGREWDRERERMHVRVFLYVQLI